MHFTVTHVVVGLLSTLASAQYRIQPSSVPIATRQTWCNNQVAQCPLICLQYPNVTGALANDCQASDLSYECVCSNGISPNSSEYSQTLPFYVCQEWGNQCAAACGSNTCADACRTQHPCGAKSPTRVNTTSASVPVAAATNSASGSQTGGAVFSTNAATTQVSTASCFADLSALWGMSAFAASFVGGMAILL